MTAFIYETISTSTTVGTKKTVVNCTKIKRTQVTLIKTSTLLMPIAMGFLDMNFQI